jgi:hypothetical protein
MQKLIPIAAIGAISALASGCHFSNHAEARDAGPAGDRSYQVGAFDRITVAGPYEVTVKTGGQPGVTAHGGEAILAETDFIVENGELRIGPKKKRGMRWNWTNRSPVRVEVSAASLREATIAGSGGIQIDRVAGGDFEGTVAGSGNLGIAQMDAGKTEFSVAGSGEVRASGKARSLDLSIAGSGDVDLSALEVVAADVSIAGSGNVRARATGTASVSIMGSGDVELTGGAKCDVTKHGSGDVRCS